MNRIRAALALGLLLLPASALAQGEKKPAATPPDEEVWHAQAVSSSPLGGFSLSYYWSRGRNLRVSTVLQGYPMLTLVHGDTYYAIDESRGHAALNRFFVEEFRGVLVTDFWRAYDAVQTRMNQKCWAHLLRELKAVDERPGDPRDDWLDFAKRLRRIFTDAVKLAAAGDAVPQAERDSKVCRLHGRMTDLACANWSHPDAARLARRLRKDGESLLTFAEFPEVPPTNNHAEREIRPAVVMRKMSHGSQSVRGAAARAILMSIYRTLKRRGLDPLAETRKALQTLSQTGTLPPLPGGQSSGG